jgi:alpha-beta hydrolase superfamily lysophospholipase
MLATVIEALTPFRDAGLDVFVYDFRGYGQSTGNSRLRAIVSDYRDIILALNNDSRYRNQKRYLYGVSFGGVVLANASAELDGGYDALVIDSSPASVSNLGCTSDKYDPVGKVPERANRVLVISGGRDRVVPHEQVKPLGDVVQERGGHAIYLKEFPHPFLEPSVDMFRARLRYVLDYLNDR